jgi:hypothetical protein
MGELARDSETRDSQDRLMVNPAGAGRQNECLSREICHSARRLATDPATGRDGTAEVSRGHSTRRVVEHSPWEGLNTQTQGPTG